MLNVKRQAEKKLFATCLLCATFVLFFTLALCAPFAWADEEELPQATESVDTNGNVVNVNQMPDSSFLYNTDISELSDAESFHDTQMVQVSGEVVGDRINDETNSKLCWITLQSLNENDSSSVSVLMSREQADLIDRYGNYHVNGTELQVRGMFYLTCPEHEGLSDLHAQEVTVLHTGSDREHTTNPAVLWAAFLAIGIGLLSLFTYRFLRERRK